MFVWLAIRCEQAFLRQAAIHGLKRTRPFRIILVSPRWGLAILACLVRRLMPPSKFLPALRAGAHPFTGQSSPARATRLCNLHAGQHWNRTASPSINARPNTVCQNRADHPARPISTTSLSNIACGWPSGRRSKGLAIPQCHSPHPPHDHRRSPRWLHLRCDAGVLRPYLERRPSCLP